MDTISLIQGLQQRFDAQLQAYTRTSTCKATILREAMNYSLLAGGKRLRPLLVYAACDAVSGSLTQADQVALAIEMFHTFSLIHDDLPAMDNDDYRRGKPTNHKIYGEDVAILAGDALHTEAFTVLAHLDLPPKTVLTMIQIIGDAIGSQGMVAGQTIDCRHNYQTLSYEALQEMHLLKTGRLITASLELGSLCNPNVPHDDVENLKRFGYFLGLAFQIQDDLLDLSGTLASLGKNPLKDLKLGKNTYPRLLGREGAQQQLTQYQTEARRILSQFSHSKTLEAVFEWTATRTY